MSETFNELLLNIDEASNDSELCVLESMLIMYNKTYDMLTEIDETTPSVFQEAATEVKKKDNVISKIMSSIMGFFKSISKAISSFFSKTKETIVEKLRKFSKSKGDSDEAQKQADEISERMFSKHNKHLKEEYVDKKEKPNEKEAKSTGVIVKERKIRTQIKFSNWISYLTELNKDLDNFINNKFKITKTRLKDKTVFLYHLFPHRYPASDVADYVEKLMVLFKQTNIKLDKASEIINEAQKTYTASMKEINSSDKWSKDYKEFDKNRNKAIEKGIRKMSENIFVAAAQVQNMTSYLASELNIYGIILDTIEPVLAKRKAASDAEEAKKKADDKEARTQHIEVHVKKDDE